MDHKRPLDRLIFTEQLLNGIRNSIYFIYATVRAVGKKKVYVRLMQNLTKLRFLNAEY
jgi:hypothetical protein